MRVLAESAYSWMLLEEDGALYLSVLCGGVASYLLEFALLPQESAQFQASGIAAISALAEQAQQQPQLFQARHLPDFGSQPALRQALQAWRTRNPA